MEGLRCQGQPASGSYLRTRVLHACTRERTRDALVCGGFACGQQAIFGSCGLNNVGLLVRVCGQFGYVNDSTFTVDDGSGTVLKCVASGGVSLNADWRTVGVTGICSCEFVDGRLKPLLRVRSSGDIDVYSP